MKQLTAEQIQMNWEELIDIINKYISFDERKDRLLTMYDDFKERMMFAPASAKGHFHNAMPGGYVEHILHIISFSLELKQIWANNGADINFTTPPDFLHFKQLFSGFSFIFCSASKFELHTSQ